jgi:hypothetical protein
MPPVAVSGLGSHRGPRPTGEPEPDSATSGIGARHVSTGREIGERGAELGYALPITGRVGRDELFLEARLLRSLET